MAFEKRREKEKEKKQRDYQEREQLERELSHAKSVHTVHSHHQENCGQPSKLLKGQEPTYPRPQPHSLRPVNPTGRESECKDSMHGENCLMKDGRMMESVSGRQMQPEWKHNLKLGSAPLGGLGFRDPREGNLGYPGHAALQCGLGVGEQLQSSPLQTHQFVQPGQQFSHVGREHQPAFFPSNGESLREEA